MRALILRQPREFTYENRPYPKCEGNDVVVKIDAVCICGSDVHAIKGDKSSFAYPLAIGHEVAGTIAETGPAVSDLHVGDRVCLMPCISCGTCLACRRGRSNSCKTLQLYGVHRDGGMQEYLATPAQYWLRIPFDARPEEISMIEPLTIGAHAVSKLNLIQGERVLIIGAGPIGMSCAVNAQTYGAQVVLAETNESRIEFGRRRFPFRIVSPLSEHYEQDLLDLTHGDLFDAVVDTTAVKTSMENAWRYLGQGGRLVFVGICNQTLEIDGRPFHMKEPALYTTRNSVRTDYERVIQQWKEKKIAPSMFITHTESFEKAADALTEWVHHPELVFKGVIRF